MTYAIASDHGGYLLKETIKKHLLEQGCQVVDYGTDSEASCDYPKFAQILSEAVASGKQRLGILVCGTGIGMSIAANKVPGIRAAVVSEHYSAKYTRMHNDSNVLCLGARVVGDGIACELVDIFCNTEFEGGRHAKRIAMISELEKNNQ